MKSNDILNVEHYPLVSHNEIISGKSIIHDFKTTILMINNNYRIVSDSFSMPYNITKQSKIIFVSQLKDYFLDDIRKKYNFIVPNENIDVTISKIIDKNLKN